MCRATTPHYVCIVQVLLGVLMGHLSCYFDIGMGWDGVTIGVEHRGRQIEIHDAQRVCSFWGGRGGEGVVPGN